MRRYKGHRSFLFWLVSRWEGSTRGRFTTFGRLLTIALCGLIITLATNSIYMRLPDPNIFVALFFAGASIAIVLAAIVFIVIVLNVIFSVISWIFFDETDVISEIVFGALAEMLNIIPTIIRFITGVRYESPYRS